MKTPATVVAGLSVLAATAVGGLFVAAVAGDDEPQQTATCTKHPKVQDVEAGQRITVVCTVPRPPAETVTVTPEPSTESTPSEEPSPTPSEEPTSTPPPTEEPTEVPGDCVKPGPSNTGATGTLAAYSGPNPITKAGTVVKGVRVNGTLVVRADNVTIRNVAATGGVFVQRAKNTTISHLTGPGVATSSGAGMTVEYSDLGGVDDGDSLTITSDSGTYITGATIRGNWIHDPRPSGGAHYDGLQVRGASNVVVDCNHFDLGSYVSQLNAAVYFEDANGGYSGVSVTRNWLTGGAWSTMWGHANDGNTVLSGNRFDGDIHWGTCYHQEPNSRPPTQDGNLLGGKPFTPCP
ncbi:right-handed parallel beta-helix repeat-containing protein [Nocardioides sp. YIM 152315]|uniref:right-handed parallel beta-helix repeat-containing protein n=1 Tax=Nocardioides sp. YIM 152315 TaxID=3031760 RepID=UPI0023DB87B7|nr:right-handed parallel beta-helix repeat-containing protein [Nocardioides sp. YIM 152315]MDF1603416.1 right-handed parallel beta-helix repeat-containing protein [Nocardioides sp. YIM 152315]